MNKVEPDPLVKLQFIKSRAEIDPFNKLQVVHDRHCLSPSMYEIRSVGSVVAVEDEEGPDLGVFKVLVERLRNVCNAVSRCKSREEREEPESACGAFEMAVGVWERSGNVHIGEEGGWRGGMLEFDRGEVKTDVPAVLTGNVDESSGNGGPVVVGLERETNAVGEEDKENVFLAAGCVSTQAKYGDAVHP